MEVKEHGGQAHERSPEVARDAYERSVELTERLKRDKERYSEKESHETAETARQEALQEALLSKEQGHEKRSHQADQHNVAQIITKEDRDASYRQTLEHIRQRLPRTTRSFSRFIHNPTIEKTSEVLSNTIARPNAVLAGSVSAFVVVLALYSYARYAGFALQGSETIVAFLAGWLLGILFDFFRVMLLGKK